MKSERERAAEYEKATGDSAQWGDATPSGPNRRLASMVSVRLTAAELDTIRTAADEAGVSVSAFIRSAALSCASPRPVVQAPHETRSVETSLGFVLNAAPAGVPQDRIAPSGPLIMR